MPHKAFFENGGLSHGVRFSFFISTVDTIHHDHRVDLKSSIAFSEVALFILTAFASRGFRLSTFYNNSFSLTQLAQKVEMTATT